MSNHELLDQIRKALEADPRIGFRSHPVALSIENNALVIEGSFKDIAAKKLALERAAALPAVTTIIDRAHTVPATSMGDAEIRHHLANALTQESVFNECAIITRDEAQDVLMHDPSTEKRGTININVVDGVVTIDGEVPSLSHKRLAGVLAWWVPGTRDVINGLGVEPDEQDCDDEVTDAVRLALEKDPFVNAYNIAVQTRNYVVTLSGIVPSESEREMTEYDAWYVFGVDKVVNKIDVRPE